MTSSVRTLLVAASIGVASAGAAAPVAAQSTQPAQAATAPVPPNFRDEFLKQLTQLEDHYVRLAEAVPQEKYGWRPAEGVRSFAEVFLHMTQSNIGFARFAGKQPPAGFDPDGFEKSTSDKAAIVQHLRTSFAHLRAAAQAIDLADADRLVGRPNPNQPTTRGLLTIVLRHGGEHLGQSIAYARMNGVVPPWSGAGN
jgi:uncharacterized damage-inducible protein DinB